MIIGIDFDGTIVENRFPGIGPEIPHAIETIKSLQKNNHKIILWTIRSDSSLDEAINFLKNRGVILYDVNKNPDQPIDSPKLFCHMYIDDRSFGCPLIKQNGKKSFVDWLKISRFFEKNGII